MNHKNERLLKLWRKGVRDVDKLSKKTGLPATRVEEFIERLVGDSTVPADKTEAV